LPFARVANDPVAKGFRIHCEVMAKSLCNRKPHAIWPQYQGAVLAEGDLNGVDERMASALLP